MIELSGLRKYYGSRAGAVRAVDGVSLTLADSGMVALFGKSGCGKTTLLNCIGGLDRADGGSVLLDGAPMGVSAGELRNRHVGYIFQNYNLSAGMTVFENVAVALRLCGVTDEGEIKKRVMAALSGVDMVKYAKRLPNTLSGGQQQRVAIARAIVKNPKVILADEPTGNLDEHNTLLVMDLLKKIAEQHLVLLVTHEARLVDLYCDRVIEIADGRVASERENFETAGFAGRVGTEIYLGDMPREEGRLLDACVEYFGEKSEMPSTVRLIASGGTLYIKADTPLRVRLLDGSAEARIHEGKYEESARRAVRPLPEALTAPLPVGEKGKVGRMYTLRSAVASGYRANFKGKRRGRRLMVASLFCFSLIVVLLVAMFGPMLLRLETISSEYSHHTVFVDSTVMKPEAVESLLSTGAADHAFFKAERTKYPRIHQDFGFFIGNFETFEDEYFQYFYASGAVYPTEVLGETPLLCGKGTLSDGEIVISRAFADELLKVTGVDYIKSYEDLLYTACRSYYWGDEERYTLVGIAEGEDKAVYMTGYQYAQRWVSDTFYCEGDYVTDVAHAGLEGKTLAAGEIILSRTALLGEAKAGDSVMIGGRSFLIKEIVDLFATVDKVAFTDYVTERYGQDIFATKSAFSVWYYGADFYDQGEWASYWGDGTRDYEKDIEALERTYANQREELVIKFMRAKGLSVFGVVMKAEDMLSLTVTGSGLTSEALSSLSSRGAGYFALYSGEGLDALAESLCATYGEDAVITPHEMREYYASTYMEDFLLAGVVVGVVLLLMSLCLYLIMRASLMGDIKDVGICRAIGVSRRNLIFRYFVEVTVLFALTELVAYLLTSSVVWGVSSIHMVMREIVYYPAWLALATLLLLFGVSVLCGILPILTLLRKSPSEILTKYDV